MWGGSASIEPLSFGVDADSFSEEQESSSKSATSSAAASSDAKDDAQFRKTLAETLQESNRVFAESLHGISQSMTDLGNTFCKSMEMLT